MTTFSVPARLAPHLRLRLGAAPAAWGAIVAGGAAIFVYYFLPSTPQSIAYVVIGSSCVAGIAIGTLRNLRPGHRLAWYLFTFGIGGQVAGDIVFTIYEVGLNREPPTPSVADAFYLGVGYPLMAIGIWVTLRKLGGPVTEAGVLDAV